jgi:hypothetical protein
VSASVLEGLSIVSRRPSVLGPLLAAVLSFVAWQPFIRPDYDLWRADDGEYHLLRIHVFEAAVRDGQWLPRWVPELFVGYGYPVFNFYAPGTYYAALILRFFGLDTFTTAQALGAIMACAGAAGAFSLARAAFGGFWPGLIAAMAYAYAPYPFITNLLIRADLAEALGLALLPWTLLAAWKAGQSGRAIRLLPLALGMGAMILSHNLTALIALLTPLAVGLFSAARLRTGIRRRGALHVGAGLVLALALTAFFWIPALVEQRDVHIEVALHGSDKAAVSWLIDPTGATAQTRRQGNPQTVYGPLDLHVSYPYDLNYPPKPSLGQGLLLAASAFLIAVLHRRRGALEAVFFLAGTMILWYCTTTWAAWAWEHVPMMRFLQFSWRLYGPFALALGLTAAGATALLGSPLREERSPATPTSEEARTTHALPPVPPGVPTSARLWGSPAVLLLLPIGLVAFLAFNTTTARFLWINPSVDRNVDGAAMLLTENALFGAGTTSGGEFVPRAVDLAGGSSQRRGNGVYERLYPEFGWLAGRVMPLEGDLRVTSLSSGTNWTDARVLAHTPGVLAFRTVFFPGWRAYLDGKEVTPRLAPRDPLLDISPGFITVDVPQGEHRIQIAFGSTPVRSVAAAVSIASLAILGGWLARRLPPHKSATTRYIRLATFLGPAAFFALACAHDSVRPAFRAPVRPGVADTRLAVDLIQRISSGQATISSPSGGALGSFVDLQRVRIGSRERHWLYMHPPASVSTTLDLPDRAAFQAGLGIDPRVWSADTGDGMRFVVEVTPAGGTTVRVLDEHLNPRAFDEHRQWVDRWVDLSVFGGQQVTLTLRTEPGPTADHDWAGWAEPAIIIQADVRRAGGGPPGPVPTPRSS